jgi:molybdopterin-guanine dinucleotide biosynthesis protein A
MQTSPFRSAADGSTRPAGAPIGVVLAGGASSRMGRDKASLEMEGESLAQRAAGRLALVCGEVVAADGGRGLVPGLRSVADGPGRGPAAGLLGAAAVHPGRPLLVLACDLPAVPVPLLAEIASSAGDLVLPLWEGGTEPLCALYGPAALALLAERVARGLFSLHDLAAAEGLAVGWLDEERLAVHGRPAEMFLNLNTPEDLERWRGLRALDGL